MLPSKNRLKKKINFARIEIDGRMIQTKTFGMGIYDRKDDSPSCFGFIISTKISKKAVVRNRIKRVMSMVIKKNLNKLKGGLDVLFLLKPSVIKLNKQDLEKETYETLIKNIQSDSLSHS